MTTEHDLSRWTPVGVAPAYPPLPWRAGWSQILSFTIEVSKPDELAALVPAPLEYSGGTLASLWCVSFDRHAGTGGYDEVLFSVPAKFAGEHGAYPPWLFVNNDVSVMLGREVMGVAKKRADVSVSREEELYRFTVTRAGSCLVTGSLAPQRELPAATVDHMNEALGGPVWGVMDSIGSPGGEAITTERLVVETRSRRTVLRAVAGPGAVAFTSSATDHLGLNGEVRVLRATLLEVDSTLATCTVKGRWSDPASLTAAQSE
jgi:acetoacetate decarboxylase